MDNNRNLYFQGFIQILVFISIMWVLLSHSKDFLILNFLLGTLIFTLGVGINIWIKKSE